MTLAHAVPDILGEIATSVELSTAINGFHLEPRCRVCRNEGLRTQVNEMLAVGTSYAMVLRSLGPDNDKLEAHDRITIDSIRNHCQRHFPVQSVAKATYRDILDRRARENQADFVEGVATALTPLAFMEVVMNKAFRTLVNDDTEVSVDTGLKAAEKLHVLMNARDFSADMAETRLWLGRILDAVKTTVPQEMWSTILKQLGVPEDPVLEDAGYFRDDEEPYDPTEFAEEDDDL